MIKLSNSINSLFKNKTTHHMFLIGSLQNKWKKTVGTHIGSATTPIKLENNTLYVKCKNPTWKNELQYQKKELLKKINKTQTKKIKDIILL